MSLWWRWLCQLRRLPPFPASDPFNKAYWPCFLLFTYLLLSALLGAPNNYHLWFGVVALDSSALPPEDAGNDVSGLLWLAESGAGDTAKARAFARRGIVI